VSSLLLFINTSYHPIVIVMLLAESSILGNMSTMMLSVVFANDYIMLFVVILK